MFEDGTDPKLELDGAVSGEQFEALRGRLPDVRVERLDAGVVCSVPGVTHAMARSFVIPAHDHHDVLLTVMFLTSLRSDSRPVPVAEGLDAVRMRPELFVRPVEAKGLLVLAMYGTAVEVCARRATNVEVGFDGLVSVSDDGARFSFDHVEDSVDTVVEQLVERVTYQRTVKGRVHDEAAVVNGLSNQFSIEVVGDGVALQQRWRLGRRVGAAAPGSRRGRFDTTLWFEPDPLLFERPLRREDVRDVVEHFANRLPLATFFFEGRTFHADTLEAAAHKVISAVPLWSEQLFVFSIDEPTFSVRVALWLCDDERPPLEVLWNARVSNPFGVGARGVCRALAKAVAVSQRTEAPSRHVAGVIAFESVGDVNETDELLVVIEQRFVEAWSVYLDAVPRARERLATLWSGQQRDAEHAGEPGREE